MYVNGQLIYDDRQLLDHMDSEVPIQVYYGRTHSDIGYINQYGNDYICVNHVYYSRRLYTFVSRPGF